MFLLQFSQNGKEYFLHDGNSFLGGSTYQEARMTSMANTGRSMALGGFTIVEKSTVQLIQAIGGMPYKIMNFEGGFGHPMMGVEVLVKQYA